MEYYKQGKNISIDYCEGKGAKTSVAVPALPAEWLKKGWVDIAKFYKEFYTLSRGSQFRSLFELKKYVDDDWTLTFLHNSNKQYVWLRNVFIWHKVPANTLLPSADIRARKFNTLASKRMRHEKKQDFYAQANDDFSAQIFEELTSIPKNINNFIEHGHDVMNKFTQSSTRVDNICVMIEEMMSKITSSATIVRGIVDKYLPLVHFLVKIAALGFLLTHKENRTYSSIAALVAIILPSGGGSAQLIGYLNRVVQGMYGTTAQAEEDVGGLITAFFKMMRDIIKSLFVDVPTNVFESMSLSAKNVKLISDTIRGVTTIVEFLVKLMDKLLTVIGDKILKYYGILPWFMKEDRLSPMIDEFVAIKLDQIDKKAQTNKEAAKRLLTLYDTVTKFESEYIKHVGRSTTLESARILPYIRVMSRQLEEATKRIPEHLRTGKNPRRVKPFWAYIYGDPRVGKTSFFQPLLINALVKALKIREHYQDYSEYTYFRNCGDEYWEKYAGQPVLWYNDLFQNYKDEQAMNNAVMELTNVVDDNLYCLNMAFEEKGAVFFDSELVISNAQSDMIGLGAVCNLCLSGGLHLYARRNVVLEFVLNKKYKTTAGLIDMVVVNQALETGQPSIAGCVPLDMYSVVFHNTVNGSIELTLPFLDAVHEVCARARAHKDKQTVFKDKLYNYYESAWQENAFAMSGEDGCDCQPSLFEDCKCSMLIYKAATLFARDRLGVSLWETPEFIQALRGFERKHTRHIDDSGAYAFCQATYQLLHSSEPVAIYRPNHGNDVHDEETFYDAVCEIYDYDSVSQSIEALLLQLTGEHVRYKIDRSYQEGDVNGFVQHFIAVNRSCDQDVIGRVALCVELANAPSFDAYTNKMLNSTIWSRFKHYAHKARINLMERVDSWINAHPALTYFGFMGLILSCLYGYLGVSASRAIKESTKQQTELYSQYNKLSPTEFNQYMFDNYQYVPKQQEPVAQTSEGKTVRAVPRIVRQKETTVLTQAYEQQNRDVEQKISTHLCKVGAVPNVFKSVSTFS